MEITSVTDMDRMVLIPSRRFSLRNSENENYKKWFREITPFRDKKYNYINDNFNIDLTKIIK